MFRYTSSSEIQVKGCKALINMGKGNEAKDLVRKCGALETLVCAMQEHAECDEVQEKVAWALGSLVAAFPENKVRKPAAKECGASTVRNLVISPAVSPPFHFVLAGEGVLCADFSLLSALSALVFRLLSEKRGVWMRSVKHCGRTRGMNCCSKLVCGL